jgi:hypothetical protein
LPNQAANILDGDRPILLELGRGFFEVVGRESTEDFVASLLRDVTRA